MLSNNDNIILDLRGTKWFTPSTLNAAHRMMLKQNPFSLEVLTAAKKMGFSDKYVARMWKCDELAVYNFRKEKFLVISKFEDIT